MDGFGDQCLELSANYFRYHVKCMNKFMSERNKTETKSRDLSLHDQTFQTLLSEVASGLMIDRYVYYIHQLSKRYDEIRKQHGWTAAL